MTTYAFTGIEVAYVGDTAVSVTPTELTITYNDGDSPLEPYTVLSTLPGELPEVDFNGGNSVDITVDGVSLNSSTFLDGPNDETLLGQINWNDGVARSATILLFYDFETDLDYLFGVNGDTLPVFSTASAFNTFVSQISSITTAAAPYAPTGPGVDLSLSNQATVVSNESVFDSNDGNLIDLGAGDDTILGNGGSDTLEGGSGNDSLDGGADDDFLYGGTGADTLNGGSGNDQLFIDSALDVVDGGAGTDRVRFETSSALNIAISNYTSVERVDGGSGNDTLDGTGVVTGLTILGFGGDDTLIGGGVSDQIQGGDGNDSLTGGGQQDFLYGGAGSDTLVGGTGNDLLFVESAGDVAIGGGGTDRVRVETDAGAILDTSLWSGIERIDGAAGNDSIDASGFATALTLLGNDGSDTLEGGSDRDVIFGNAGSDSLIGNAGIDVLVGGTGADVMDGGADDDTFFLDGSADVVLGGAGLDRARFDNGVSGVNLAMTGWSGLDRLTATTGNDTIDGSSQSGDLVLNGNAGNDSLVGGSGADFLFGAAGDDTLVGNDGADRMYGNAGLDVHFGGGGDDIFFLDDNGDRVADGGSGSDRAVLTKAGMSVVIDGTWSGLERVDGVAGAEVFNAIGYGQALTVVANAGADEVLGTSFADTIFGGAGADEINGGAGGNDFLYGGLNDGAVDTFIFEDGAGTDRVFEFEDGIDLLDVTAITGVNGLFANLTVTAAGSNTNVTAGAETIVLIGIDSADVDVGDFFGLV